MKIEPQALLDDVLEIIVDGGTYLNRETGEIINAVPHSTLISRLRDGIGRPRRWKNVSDIKEFDLEDSGFTLALANGNYNCGRGRKVGDWVATYIDHKGERVTGRTVSRATFLITV